MTVSCIVDCLFAVAAVVYEVDFVFIVIFGSALHTLKNCSMQNRKMCAQTCLTKIIIIALIQVFILDKINAFARYFFLLFTSPNFILVAACHQGVR